MYYDWDLRTFQCKRYIIENILHGVVILKIISHCIFTTVFKFKNTMFR
jgi:hypothetical protein